MALGEPKFGGASAKLDWSVVSRMKGPCDEAMGEPTEDSGQGARQQNTTLGSFWDTVFLKARFIFNYKNLMEKWLQALFAVIKQSLGQNSTKA